MSKASVYTKHIGTKVNKLTIHRHFLKNKVAYFECECECGNIKEINASNVLRNLTKSCGCLYNAKEKEYENKYGFKKTTLYKTWYSMKNRCLNPVDISYKNYGGRGIMVSEEFMNFDLFTLWANKTGFKKGLQLDRIDFNGNYTADNCQWVTIQENLAIGKKRMSAKNKSGYTGVSFDLNSGKWIGRITANRKQIALGYYQNINDAVQARINAEIMYLGSQKTNFHYESLPDAAK